MKSRNNLERMERFHMRKLSLIETCSFWFLWLIALVFIREYKAFRLFFCLLDPLRFNESQIGSLKHLFVCYKLLKNEKLITRVFKPALTIWHQF